MHNTAIVVLTSDSMLFEAFSFSIMQLNKDVNKLRPTKKLNFFDSCTPTREKPSKRENYTHINCRSGQLRTAN